MLICNSYVLVVFFRSIDANVCIVCLTLIICTIIHCCCRKNEET